MLTEQSTSRFDFVTDEESAAYCEMIVEHLIVWFGISEEEAVGRINRHFQGLAILGEVTAFYHEMPEDWAGFIYYESGVHWWVKGEELRRKPYP